MTLIGFLIEIRLPGLEMRPAVWAVILGVCGSTEAREIDPGTLKGMGTESCCLLFGAILFFVVC